MIPTGYGERLDVAFSFLVVTWVFSGPASAQVAHTSVGNPSDLREGGKGKWQDSSLPQKPHSCALSKQSIYEEGKVNRQRSYNRFT